jgi:uncharacterized protein (TIGR00255 family)
MTLSSMTGFARTAGHDAAATWSWELRSVNAKGLDVRLRLPPHTEGLEAEVRRMIGAVVARGTIHATLDLTRHDSAAEVRINEDLARGLLRRLATLADAEGVARPGLEAVLSVRGVIEAPEGSEALPDAVRKAVVAAFEDAVVGLVAARRAEGEALGEVLGAKLADISARVAAAEALPSRSAEAIRERLARQLRDLMGEAAGGALDPQRLHQEAVLLAVKADVREEIDRLKAHVAQGQELLKRGGAVGRKLDFLAQELSREVNTLCAKSNDVDLTGLGLELKGLVEQFREQVQNVE